MLDYFTLSENHNLNYCAEIITIDNLTKHENADKLQCTNIKGNTIITDLRTQLGDYVVYFPIECSIDNKILHELSLYRDSTKNKNIEKKGLFETNGRIKAVKLRGEKSEGFILPYNEFLSVFNIELIEPKLNVLFDTFDTNPVCKKYVNQTLQMSNSSNGSNSKGNKKSKRYNIVEDQFRFHKDTEKLCNNIRLLKPEAVVQITKKYHGTSAISAKLLVNVPKTKSERIITKIVSLASKVLKSELNVNKHKYVDIYSSRTVIKNDNQDSYYKCDIWKLAHDVMLPYLSDGMSIYYEIIGYLPTGSMIQKNYNYGFDKPENETFLYNKHYGIKVYRITHTNDEGKVYEMTSQQIINFCNKNDILEMLPKELYYGNLSKVYTEEEVPRDFNFGTSFFNKIKNDEIFGMETIDPECKGVKVPFEGLVFRFESPNYLDKIVSYKLKCFRFLEVESKQLDSNVTDIEEEN